MLAALLILFFAFFTVFFIPNYRTEPEEEPEDVNKTPQIRKLWGLAQGAMREQKPMKAEKALLTILRFDEKNAAAYNRLGILYAKSQKYDEAVECFEIAQSLDNNPSSIHNAGLIYLETGEYEKAAIAFEQAIALEGDVPARFIALAKAEEKLGNYKKAISALEEAYALDTKVSTLRQMLALYELMDDKEGEAEIVARIEEQTAEDAKKKAAPIKKLRRPQVAPKTIKKDPKIIKPSHLKRI